MIVAAALLIGFGVGSLYSPQHLGARVAFGVVAILWGALLLAAAFFLGVS